MNNIFEVLESITDYIRLDADTFISRYFYLYGAFGNPSETMTHFEYGGRFILHRWDTEHGEEYLWIIRNSSGTLSYLAGSKRKD